MKVLHIAASLSSKWGGPTRVIIGLTEALSKKGVKVSIFAPTAENEKGFLEKPEGVNIRLFRKSFPSKFWTSYSPGLAKALREEAFDFDLFHIHEIWHHPHFAAYQAARFARKCFVITIHGSLEPWCLNHKAFKKKIYSMLIQRKILREASALHAITGEEVRNIAKFVGNKNVLLIPNGLNLEEFENFSYREQIDELYPDIRGKKIILFLGRLHPKKGLDILAKAFQLILKQRDDIQLLIVGPDSNGYKEEIVKILKAENAIVNVTFTGMLRGDDKLAALSRADIFVLPSYSEGFSISILEAMACGLPVVVTKECNFPEVEEIGAGKVIDPDAGQLSEALIELLENQELCKEMGKRGKRLIQQKYTWDKVADKMIIAYEEILAGQRVYAEGKR